MTPAALVEQLRGAFGEAIGEAIEFRGDWAVTVDRAKILPICRYLKESCAFTMLSDLTGVDHYGETPRFEVHYTLYSFQHAYWFRLKCRLPEADPVVDSVTSVWTTANWHEREAWDLMGLRFQGHPNLARIIMWEGYPYHPLRKDFPLAGLPAPLPSTAVEAGAAETAPMNGGPFVAPPGDGRALRREPRQYHTKAEQADQQAAPLRREEV